MGEVLSEVLVGSVVEALDGGFLEGSVHAFNLAVVQEFWLRLVR